MLGLPPCGGRAPLVFKVAKGPPSGRKVAHLGSEVGNRPAAGEQVFMPHTLHPGPTEAPERQGIRYPHGLSLGRMKPKPWGWGAGLRTHQRATLPAGAGVMPAAEKGKVTGKSEMYSNCGISVGLHLWVVCLSHQAG